MIYRTRKIVKVEDLNPRGTLFGGRLLSWVDEEAAIYAICQVKSKMVVTKFISSIDFKSSPKVGDIIEIGTDLIRIGTTSITFKVNVRNKMTQEDVITIDQMLFVKVDEDGRPSKIDKNEVF